MSFVVPKEAQDRWMDLGNIGGDGTRVRVRFEAGRGMIVQRFLDPKIVQAVRDDATVSRDTWRKGRLLNGARRHWLPVAKLTAQENAQWKAELGEPNRNPKAWKKRLNDPDYNRVRTSEYRV